MKKSHLCHNASNRREFLLGITGLALATVVPSCRHSNNTDMQAQKSEPEITAVTDQELDVSCAWVAKDEHEEAYSLFKKTVEATTDFEWLSKGDRVLVKIALNSGHPAIVNSLKRMGGRPRSIAIEELNHNPNRSVGEYFKTQLVA